MIFHGRENITLFIQFHGPFSDPLTMQVFYFPFFSLLCIGFAIFFDFRSSVFCLFRRHEEKVYIYCVFLDPVCTPYFITKARDINGDNEYLIDMRQSVSRRNLNNSYYLYLFIFLSFWIIWTRIRRPNSVEEKPREKCSEKSRTIKPPQVALQANPQLTLPAQCTNY